MGIFYIWHSQPYFKFKRGKVIPGRRSASNAAMFVHGQNILLANHRVIPDLIFSKTVKGRRHHTKTDVVVPVVWIVVVADRDARVVFIVVPRAAPQTL
jgi:hypothetical protein